MTFSYQKLSLKDIERNNLNKLYRQYAENAGYYNDLQKGRHLEGWMIDKEENIWLCEMCCLEYDVGLPPRRSLETYYILGYKGKTYEILMRRNYNEGSRKVSDSPFKIRWEIISIVPQIFKEVRYRNIIEAITSALEVHPYQNTRKYMKKIDVKVNCLVTNTLKIMNNINDNNT